jgi:hypothetical protein
MPARRILACPVAEAPDDPAMVHVRSVRPAGFGRSRGFALRAIEEPRRLRAPMKQSEAGA